MVDELVEPGVEIAEKGPDFERRVGEEAGARNRPAPAEVERADDDVLLGERYLADNLQYAFLAYLRADVQVAQPTAFAVDTGVRA